MNHVKERRIVVQIVTHNNEHTIGTCIRSVLHQHYRNFALLVIDNASTDKTTEIVRRLRVPLLHNTENMGYAAGHNMGFRHSKSEYVITLNPDVTLKPDFLETIVAVMDNERDRVGSAQGLLFRVNTIDSRSTIIDSAGLYLERNRRQGLWFAEEDIHKVRLRRRYIFGPDGAAACYKRKMLDDIAIDGEIFDEDFFMHKEDVDICYRAQLRGWQSIMVPEAVGYHIRAFRAGYRKSISKDMKRLAVRNRYFLMIKNEIPAIFMRDIMRIVWYDIKIFVYLMCFEHASLAAYGEVMRAWKRMYAKRQVIQSKRRVTGADMEKWFR